MLPVALALVWFTLATLASGCGGSSKADADQPSSVLLTRSLAGDEDEMDAIPSGTLELDLDRGCILLSGKAVVWPAETTLSIEPPELHLPGDLTARAGDTVRGGGGEVPAARIRETSLRIEGDLSGALDCLPADGKVIVFNSRGDAIGVIPGD